MSPQDLPSLPLVAVGIAPVLFAVVIFWAGTLPFSVSSAITGGSGGANITAWSAVEADKTYDSIKSFSEWPYCSPSVQMRPHNSYATARPLFRADRIFVSSTAVIWTAEFLHSFVVAVVALAVGGWYFKPQTGAPESVRGLAAEHFQCVPRHALTGPCCPGRTDTRAQWLRRG